MIVFGHRSGKSEGPATLLPVPAPWHAAGVDWELAGAKVLSYAPTWRPPGVRSPRDSATLLVTLRE